MRILIVHNRYLVRGGEDVVMEAEVELLRSHGHEVTVYEETNERIGQIGRLRTAMRTVWSIESYNKVRRLMEKRRPDVMHVHNFFPLISPSVYDAATHLGVPVVQTLSNYRLFCLDGCLMRDNCICEECLRLASPWPGVKRACYRSSVAGSIAVATMLLFHRAIGTWHRKVTKYIALTEFARNKLIEAGMPPEKMCVKPNFLPNDPEMGERGADYGLFVGRLSAEKGIALLIDAWRRAGLAMSLLVAGAGPLRQELQTDIHGSGCVQLLGFISGDAVHELMKSAAFVILPSVCYETMPRTLVEAFACGAPVIASRLGSMAEMIEDGISGLLFRAGDAGDMAEKIRWADTHRAEMREIGMNGRREYEQKYTADRNYKLLMDIYEKAGQRMQCRNRTD